MPLMMPGGREVEWEEGEMEGEKTWELVFKDDRDDMSACVSEAGAQFRWEVFVGPNEWPKPGYEPTLEAAKAATQRALGIREG